MIKKIGNLKDKFIEETIKALFMASIYFFYNKDIYTQKDFYTKLRDSSAIIIPYIIYIIIVSFSSIKTKPIIIDIKMRNSSVEDKEETILYHYKDFREDARRIKLSISLRNQSTVWARIAMWLYKKCKFEVEVSLIPATDELICQPCIYLEEVEENIDKFRIDITDLIINKLDYNVPCVKVYPFIINENEDKPPVKDDKYFIKPILLLNGKKMNFIHRRFVDVNIDLKEGYYLVHFIK